MVLVVLGLGILFFLDKYPVLKNTVTTAIIKKADDSKTSAPGTMAAASSESEEKYADEVKLTLKMTEEKIKKSKETVIPDKVILDVPLFNQMDAPKLYNGCEVTSLAMLLNYNGIKVTKNDLANRINHVPLKYGDGKNGNPNVGFVGNMEHGPGLGVYHKPIFDLAQLYIKNRVIDITKQPFSVVIDHLAQNKPVWVITTATFAPTSEMKTWSTPQGPVEVSFKMHSVVITGFDQDSIYINNPYGTKNQKVNKENFIKAWEQMGSQAIVINS